MYPFAHLNTARDIIAHYEGADPFHHFIKGYFREHKKAGSRDRKQITHLCYSYFRIGKMMAANSFEERMIAALFLCEEEPSDYLHAFEPSWNEQLEDHPSLAKKLQWLTAKTNDIDPSQIFPFDADLSDGINRQDFILSHVKQPDLHIRLRPNASASLIKQLSSIPGFLSAKEDTMVFKNGTRLDEQVSINKDFVVQDQSSQQVREFFPAFPSSHHKVSIWDACAASGGKSIMAYDHYKNIELTVTDIRSSILVNLKERLAQAGITGYHSMVTDLSKAAPIKAPGQFDLVMADVPCSGSGTWGRTPEQLVMFPQNKIGEYQLLQRAILRNLFTSVKPGGYLLYITCSVFKQENEENVQFILGESGYQHLRSGIIKGYDHKADTMFAALFARP